MKTIYKILLLTIILQTSAFSQFEVLSIIKPTTSADPCDGKINLEFVESELPYDLEYSSSTGQQGSYQVTTSVFSITGLCAGTISISATDNHGCDTELDPIELEECGDLYVSYIQEDEGCDYAGINLIATIHIGEDLAFTWSNGQTTKDLINVKPGTYSVSIVDAFNCKKEYSFNITRPLVKSYEYPSSEISQDGSITIEANGEGAPYTLQLFDSDENELYVTDISEFSSGIFTFPTGLWYGSYKIIVSNSFGCERILYHTFNSINCNLKVEIVDLKGNNFCSPKCCDDIDNDDIAEVEFGLIGDQTNINQYNFSLSYRHYGLNETEYFFVDEGIGKNIFRNLESIRYYKLTVTDKDNQECKSVLDFRIPTCNSIWYSSDQGKCISHKPDNKIYVSCSNNIEGEKANGEIYFRSIENNPNEFAFKLIDPNGNIIDKYSIHKQWISNRESYYIYYKDLGIPGTYCLIANYGCSSPKTICVELEMCTDPISCKGCDANAHCFNGIQDYDEVGIDCGGSCLELSVFHCYHCWYCNSDPNDWVGNNGNDGNGNGGNGGPTCVPNCEPGWECVDGECYKLCDDTNPPPPGKKCTLNGYCIDENSTDCVPDCNEDDGYVCTENSCMHYICDYDFQYHEPNGEPLYLSQYLFTDGLLEGQRIHLVEYTRGIGLSVRFSQNDETLWEVSCTEEHCGYGSYPDCNHNYEKYFRLLYSNIPVLLEVKPNEIESDNGCYGLKTWFEVKLECVTGQRQDIASSNDFESKNRLFLYPNPFTSIFSVFSQSEKIKEIKVLNAFGQLVNNVKLDIPNLQTNIELKNEPAGIFYVKILLENNEIVTKKIVKSY